jgi:hypothetical protein
MSEVQLKSSAYLFCLVRNQGSQLQNWNAAKMDSAFHLTTYAKCELEKNKSIIKNQNR